MLQYGNVNKIITKPQLSIRKPKLFFRVKYMHQAIMFATIRHIPVGHSKPCFRYRGTTKKRIIPNKNDRPIILLLVCDSNRLSMQNIQYPVMIKKYRENAVRIIAFTSSLFNGFPNVVTNIYIREWIAVITITPI